MRVRHRRCAPIELCLPAIQEEALGSVAGDVIEAQQTASQLGIIPALESIQFKAIIRIDVAQC